MIVYHGTPNDFEDFSYDFIQSNGTDEGYGFYFTNNKYIAKRFGNVLECEINLVKPLSLDEKTITKEEIKTLILAIQEKEDLLSNYGDTSYEGFNKVFNYCIENEYDYNNNDVDIICSLCNSCGNKELVLKLTSSLLGYNYIVKKDKYEKDCLIYVLLNNEDIKIKKT